MTWDDDDWVGEPPEGRHSRDRAKPEFWRARLDWRAGIVGALILLAAAVAVVVALLSS